MFRQKLLASVNSQIYCQALKGRFLWKSLVKLTSKRLEGIILEETELHIEAGRQDAYSRHVNSAKQKMV